MKNYSNEIDKKQIIYESTQQHARFIPESASDTLYNCIVKIVIELGLNKTFATGFFLKVILNIKKYKFLLTNFHVITKDLIDKGEIIKIYYGKKNQENEIKIRLEKTERIIQYFNFPVDVTFVEIIENDNIPENKFLFPDFNYKNGYDFYREKNIYLAGYPTIMNGDRCISSGQVKEIEEIREFPGVFQLIHTLDTSSGSSGSPICLFDNYCVIGLHKASEKGSNNNYGTFIGALFDKLDLNKKKEIKNEKEKDKKEEKKNNYYYNVCKSICKINHCLSLIGFGFLILLYKESKPFHCLITNEHILKKEMIKTNEEIEIYYNNDKKKKKIFLNNNERFIQDFRYINIDVTIVEILSKDNINDCYFLLGNLDYINNFINLENNNYYMPYFEGNDFKFIEGNVKLTEKYEFSISSNDIRNSGFPIFLTGTSLVIAINSYEKKKKCWIFHLPNYLFISKTIRYNKVWK